MFFKYLLCKYIFLHHEFLYGSLTHPSKQGCLAYSGCSVMSNENQYIHKK